MDWNCFLHVTHISDSCASALAGLCDVGCPLAVGISVVNSASGPSPTRRRSSGRSSNSRFVPRGDPLTVYASGPLPVNFGSSGGVSAKRFRICLALRSSASLADDPTGGVTCAPGAIGGGNVLLVAPDAAVAAVAAAAVGGCRHFLQLLAPRLCRFATCPRQSAWAELVSAHDTRPCVQHAWRDLRSSPCSPNFLLWVHAHG